MPIDNWNINKIMDSIEIGYKSENIELYWESEKEYVECALENLNRLLSHRFVPNSNKPLFGVGGSSIVLRITDNMFPNSDVALKFPRPVPGKKDLIIDMISKEIFTLADLKHPGISRIIQYGTMSNVEGYGELPYYIMEAANGDKSTKYINKSKNINNFIDIIRKTADIINFLHHHPSGGFAHLDIKPDNVVINEIDNKVYPVLIDLGTCKRFSPDETKTIIACTLSYAHPSLVRLLDTDPSDEKRVKGTISRIDIVPRFDLFSLGLTILDWLGIKRDGVIYNGGIYNDLDPYTRKYILLLIARLIADHPLGWLNERINISNDFVFHFMIQSAEELCNVINRLYFNKAPLDDVIELKNAVTGTLQAAPGIYIVKSERIKKVIGHRFFRRLNTITQLGLVYQVYPGAKHTRREHCLGTYANTIKIVKSLLNDPISPLFRQIITEKDCFEILLTSLLHDIGQFPLAHDLEEIDNNIFNHNELTISMLKGIQHAKGKGTKEIKFDPLVEVFKSWGTDKDRIISILMAKPSSTDALPKDKLLRSIISGPIDSDKLDYLLRDGRHLNLPYPKGIDVDRVYNCLTTIIIKRVRGGIENVPSIGIHAKGRVAAEFMSIARYAMFCQAYWHHAVRAQKAMLRRATEALININRSRDTVSQFKYRFYKMVVELPESLFESYLVKNTPLFSEQDQGTELAPTDAAVLSWLLNELRNEKLPESVLITGIIKRNLYKRLWVISYHMEPNYWERIVKLWDNLSIEERYELPRLYEKLIKDKISQNPVDITELPGQQTIDRIKSKTAGNIPWLLIDVPGARPGSEIGLQCVLETQGRRMRKDDNIVGELRESIVWEEYAFNLRQSAGKIRIFCDEELVDAVDANINQSVGIEQLINALEQVKK